MIIIIIIYAPSNESFGELNIKVIQNWPGIQIIIIIKKQQPLNS